MTAVHVLDLLRKKQRQIKRKISVISIDDIEESQDTFPMLTTIRIPRKEMAHMAVMVLLDRMRKGHAEAVRIEFQGRVVERSSCFPYEEK